MVVVLKKGATGEEIEGVKRIIEEEGLRTTILYGDERTVIAMLGDERSETLLEHLRANPCVEEVKTILKKFKLVSRETRAQDLVIPINGVKVGAQPFYIAGPCSVESLDQIMNIAVCVKMAGADMLRGGAFKPRTNVAAFQGLGEKGLKYLKKAKELTGLPIVTEVMGENEIDLVMEYAGVLQIGSRNCQNYKLLEAVGLKTSSNKKPVLLKRGMSVSGEEFLQAAEYIVAQGNPNVILCLRGVKPEDKPLRNMPDIGMIPVLRELTYLPVIFDPSHAVGNFRYVDKLAYAAVGAGAQGLIIECHLNPEKALSDGDQSVKPKMLERIIGKCNELYRALEQPL